MKINSYGILANPQLGDKLIGTDINDMFSTKNFLIGDILELGTTYFEGTFVPYVNPVADVNLGSHSITANSFVKVGGTSSQFLKADGSVDSSSYLTASNIQLTQVLNGTSTVSQTPSALDTPLIVNFGAAQGSSSTDVELQAGGKIIFHRAGAYFINGFGSVERQGSSGGVAVLLFRVVLNGTQVSTTKGFHLDTPNLPTEYEVTIPFQANAGDVLEFQIMRDSSGVNAGGVYPHTNLGGWPNVPSTQIQIWKVN